MAHSKNALQIAIACLVLAGAPDEGQAAKCLKATDAVSGDLRKVVSRRPSNREQITGWHILTSEPLCVTIGDGDVSNLNDIQVMFAKSVDLKDLDESLGWAVGVKGHMEYRPDDSFTGDVVVMDAVLYTDLDDAGEVRRK